MQIEPATCPVCGRRYDPLRARSILVVGGAVRAFCSPECKARDGLPKASVLDEPEPPSSASRTWMIAVATSLVVGAVLILVLGKMSRRPALAAVAQAAVVPPPPVTPPTMADLPSLMAPSGPQAGGDVWIHPLVGPDLHLPARNTRRFGAPREGLRPEECGSGHCGVDLGTEKGAAVMAVHDGVIERIERDPEVGGRRGNEGRFIRINHRGGHVVSSYMHLDGIRNDLRPGLPVKAGELIGTVGDTGVQHSGPHLHFAISIRRDANGEELFIDPEPLLHLWPTQDHAPATLQGMELTPAPRHPPLSAKASGVAPASPPEKPPEKL